MLDQPAEDISPVLHHYWQQLGLPFDPTDPQGAATAITRATGATSASSNDS